MSGINLRKFRFDNNLSQEELGKILNITKQQVSRIEKGKAKLTLKNQKILTDKYPDSLQSKQCDENFIELDYYPNSLGSFINGTFTMSREKKKCRLPANLFTKIDPESSYIICHAKGSAMSPLIDDGDFIVLEKNEKMQIQDDEIYLFKYEDRIYLKQLSMNINQIVVTSKNPNFQTQYIEQEKIKGIDLIGKIICHGRLYSSLTV